MIIIIKDYQHYFKLLKPFFMDDVTEVNSFLGEEFNFVHSFLIVDLCNL